MVSETGRKCGTVKRACQVLQSTVTGLIELRILWSDGAAPLGLFRSHVLVQEAESPLRDG